MPSRPDDLHDRIPDRHHRARVYWGVIETVRHTGDERPGISEHELKRNRTSAGHPLGDVASAVRAAVENGHLVRVPDRDGHTRYVIAEKSRLREAVSWLAEWDDPPHEVIGALNQRIAACEE